MPESSAGLWSRITAMLTEASTWVPSDAREHRLECDETVALLEVRFETADRSAFYTEFYRPSSTVVMGFGARQNISDYPVTEENIEWYAEVIAAVARGGWAEEDLRWGVFTVCRAVLPLPSGPASFYCGFPWVAKRAGAPYRVHRYAAWK